MVLSNILRATTLIVTLIAPLCALNNSTLHAHEFDDGYVERSVSYLLRDQRLTVEYSVGMNPNTMYEFLKKWEIEIPADLEKQISDRAELTQTEKPQDASTKGPSVVAIESADPVDMAIEALFRANVETQIKKNLQVLLNDRPLSLKLDSVDISPRHHVNLTVRLAADVPAAQQQRIRAIDTNFIEQDGGVRYAFKGLGRAMVLASNVEPVLVRAERVELGKIKANKRLKYTTVDTKVGFVPPKTPSQSPKSSKQN